MTTTLGNIGQTDQAQFLTSDLSTGETPMYNPYDQCFYYVDSGLKFETQFYPLKVLLYFPC